MLFKLKILILIFALSSCTESDSNTLVMGTSADYPPFESYQNNQFVGFDIDLAQALAEHLGYKLEIKDIDFNGLIPAINSGVIDFAISALSPTTEREKNIDFTINYYPGLPSIVFKKNNLIANIEDLSNKVTGVQLGSIWENYCKSKSLEIDNLKIFSSNRIPQLVEELKLNRIQAIILDQQQAANIVDKHPDFALITMDQIGKGYAIALRKNSKLTPKLNKALAEIIDLGIIDNIKKKWLR